MDARARGLREGELSRTRSRTSSRCSSSAAARWLRRRRAGRDDHMQSWMFYRPSRSFASDFWLSHTIDRWCTLARGAFDIIGGEVVATTAFVLSSVAGSERRGAVVHLADGSNGGDEAATLARYSRRPDSTYPCSSDADRIFVSSRARRSPTGSPDAMRDAFAAAVRLRDVATPRQGHGDCATTTRFCVNGMRCHRQVGVRTDSRRSAKLSSGRGSLSTRAARSGSGTAIESSSLTGRTTATTSSDIIRAYGPSRYARTTNERVLLPARRYLVSDLRRVGFAVRLLPEGIRVRRSADPVLPREADRSAGAAWRSQLIRRCRDLLRASCPDDSTSSSATSRAFPHRSISDH